MRKTQWRNFLLPRAQLFQRANSLPICCWNKINRPKRPRNLRSHLQMPPEDGPPCRARRALPNCPAIVIRLYLASGAEGFEGPGVLGFLTAQDVALAIGEENAEKRGARGVPAVFNFEDVQHLAGDSQSHRALVGLVSGVAFDVDALVRHGRRVRRLSARSAFHAAPRKMITVESSIQISRPMTAASPP